MRLLIDGLAVIWQVIDQFLIINALESAWLKSFNEFINKVVVVGSGNFWVCRDQGVQTYPLLPYLSTVLFSFFVFP